MEVHIYFLALISICASASVSHPLDLEAHIPDPDGKLHIYALPIGQGDSTIIQCPDGAINIYDLGSSNKGSRYGFWDVVEIEDFLDGRFDDITNVIVTHNHFDHYSFLEEVLGSDKDMSGLRNVYISCTPEAMRSNIADWLADIGQEDKVRTVNGGDACGMNGIACGFIELCPGNPNIITKIMSANYGQCSQVYNSHSLVLKIQYGDISVLLNGDFEDFTTSWSENGPQRSMVEYYGDELQSTVYHVSHHGATSKANKPVIRDALRPKALMVSGNFEYQYGHPRCVIFDSFRYYVPEKTVCKPGVDRSSQYYCGEYIDPSVPTEDRTQAVYTCGESATSFRRVTSNDFAIYSTTPTEDTLNLVTFSTDGDKWGFRNHITPRV